MKISVIGPGAMGCLFATRLANSGASVTLVDHDTDRAARLMASGTCVDSPSGSMRAHPNVVSTVPKGQDLIIVCVKSYSTESLILPSDAPILTLQGGLRNVETLCSEVGSSNILAGATGEAVELKREGQVNHVCSGPTRIGSWTSCSTKPAKEALRKAGFQVETTEAPGQTLWEETAITCGIAPITALLDITNGQILEIPEARQLMRDLVVESVKVASTEGYRFDRSLVESAEEFCRRTQDHISPMLHDVRIGKRTEIDAMSGEILRRAQLAALPTPRTRVVWQLVRGLEQR